MFKHLSFKPLSCFYSAVFHRGFFVKIGLSLLMRKMMTKVYRRIRPQSAQVPIIVLHYGIIQLRSQAIDFHVALRSQCMHLISLFFGIIIGRRDFISSRRLQLEQCCYCRGNNNYKTLSFKPPGPEPFKCRILAVLLVM